MIPCGYDIIPAEERYKNSVPKAELTTAIVFRGREQGKTLVITGGVHGCEYGGYRGGQKNWEIIHSG